MSRSTNLIIWLIGLLGCAIPIVIIYVSNMVPNAGTVTGVTFMDVARQAYANVLFLVIAVSGIAIAEAIILFFKMVEVGEQKATPALWLLTMVLLIVFSSISYARVLGGDFDPESVSDQQLMLACIGAGVAILAALSLRMSMIRLEGVARQHIHDNAVMNTLDDMRDGHDDQIDMYEYDPFPTSVDVKEVAENAEGRIPDPPSTTATEPAEPKEEPKPELFEPAPKVAEPAIPKPPEESKTPKTVVIERKDPEEPEPRLPETPAAPVVLTEKVPAKRATKAADAEPAIKTQSAPASGSKVKRARARARAKSR